MMPNRYFGVAFAFLIAVLVLGCGESKEVKKGYVLNQTERYFLNYLLNEELKISLQSGNAILTTGMLVTSAKEVATAYEKNEVAADQMYDDKLLILEAIVHEINSGIGNEPIIILAGGRGFLRPRAYFDKPDIGRISALSKGDRIKLVCLGNGITLGSPGFKKCAFSDKYFSDKIVTLRSQIEAYLSGSSVPDDDAFSVIVVSIAIARNIGDESACLKEKKGCERVINKAEKKLNSETIKAIISELRAAGLKEPKNKPGRESMLSKVFN